MARIRDMTEGASSGLSMCRRTDNFPKPKPTTRGSGATA
jgi:hypothetical protein